MTKYPNLLAEYETGNGGHIITFCEHANVTEELMRAVFYDGEDLELDEAIALTRLLGCGADYLFSPKWSFTDNYVELLLRKGLCFLRRWSGVLAVNIGYGFIIVHKCPLFNVLGGLIINKIRARVMTK